MSFHTLRGALALSLVLALSGTPSLAQDATKPAAVEATVVFAAASLKESLDEASAAFGKAGGQPVSISYAASSALAKQIEQGAPADLFVSADLDWMDYLGKAGRIDPATRVTLLGNSLVLVATKGAGLKTEIAPGFDLIGLLGADGRLAMANLEAVPAGKYGKAALESLGVFDGVEKRIAQTDNVRAALALVSRGEAPLGIVYATDARADPGVEVVGSFPEATHPPILYPVALTATARPEARAFLDFLRSQEAAAIFSRRGFRVVDRTM